MSEQRGAIMNEVEILEKIKKSYQTILQKKLVGIYVHGSIAFRCFNWDKSDIDFLVVVSEKLCQEEKEALIMELLRLDKHCPPKGLEMSVVLETVCKPFVYPTPFELHFSNTHKERCQADLAAYCQNMHGVDKDLAAHVTVINQVGMTLCGKEIANVFGAVSKQAYMDSIWYDIENAGEDIDENPVYIILNLCRVLAHLEENVVLSKKQGGEWGLDKLPAKYHPLLQNALSCYQNDTVFIKSGLEREFAKNMLNRIEEKGKYVGICDFN